MNRTTSASSASGECWLDRCHEQKDSGDTWPSGVAPLQGALDPRQLLPFCCCLKLLLVFVFLILYKSRHVHSMFMPQRTLGSQERSLHRGVGRNQTHTVVVAMSRGPQWAAAGEYRAAHGGLSRQGWLKTAAGLAKDGGSPDGLVAAVGSLRSGS